MSALRLPYGLARMTTAEETFLAKSLVSVSYDGVFIGTAQFDVRFWRDTQRHLHLLRERAIRTTVRQCRYPLSAAQFTVCVAREGDRQ